MSSFTHATAMLPAYEELESSPPEYMEDLEVVSTTSTDRGPIITKTFVCMLIDYKRSHGLRCTMSNSSAAEVRSMLFGRMTPRTALVEARKLVMDDRLRYDLYVEFVKAVCYILEWEQLGSPFSIKRLRSKIKGRKIKL